MRKDRSLAFCAAIGSLLVAAAGTAVALPTCAQLASDPANGLAGNPQISSLTAAVQAASGSNKPYCLVNFTFSGESGPSAGYLPGQSQQLKIAVGLPPNSADIAANPTITAGAVPWNQRNRDLGGGGYAGAVGPVTSSTNLGYVGTSTDTGHSAALGGSFALNPDGTLNFGLIEDFSSDGIHEQHVWGVQLAQTYYGAAPIRKYWMGCSTGGRQGHYQAQNFPRDLDGILAGANAYNWDRFITAELWPEVVMNQWVGHPIASAKLNAVTAAAIAACDAQDPTGLQGDGFVQDPRACTYSAKSFMCGLSSDPNCLTPQEALAVNKIWDGPRDYSNGMRAWYGLDRGASLLGLAGSTPFSIATDHFKYWIYQNPNFDWHTVTETSFLSDLLTSIQKFNDVIGTDDNLNAFRAAGGKMITYHGLADQLIFSRGTYHYYNTIAQGNYADAQTFYRYFPYPGNGHCGGGNAPLIDGEALFTALVNWVENGVAPDFVVATQTTGLPSGVTTRTRKVCMYPNVPVYDSGDPNNQASFHCQTQSSDPLSNTLDISPQYETSTTAHTDPGPD